MPLSPLCHLFHVLLSFVLNRSKIMSSNLTQLIYQINHCPKFLLLRMVAKLFDKPEEILKTIMPHLNVCWTKCQPQCTPYGYHKSPLKCSISYRYADMSHTIEIVGYVKIGLGRQWISNNFYKIPM